MQHRIQSNGVSGVQWQSAYDSTADDGCRTSRHPEADDQDQGKYRTRPNCDFLEKTEKEDA